ncbi:MAG: gliding motility-associated-like protein [Cryomorphaceae bacterium]|jgi:gliding motility-associated-like protein
MKTLLRLSALSLLFLSFSFLSLESFAQVSISCPSDIDVDNDAGLCEATVVYTAPIGTGSGTNITTTLTGGLPSGSLFPVGTTIVEYTVTNDEGDSDVCTFQVTVADSEDPIIDCPPDININAAEGECTQVVTYPIPTATDNCGPVTVTQIGGLPSGSVFPIGESFLDFQTTDAAGNDGFCRVIVLVSDITDPEITCPADIVVDIFNSCDTIINYTAPIGNDACGPATTTQTAGLGSGSIFLLGTTTETYEVTDAEGNTASCSFDITVNDAADPIINNCPVDIAQSAPVGTCEDIVTFTDPTATDNCPGVVITQTDGPVSGSTFPVGTTDIEFTATDASGNTTLCSFTITLTESTAPEITCPADIVVSNDLGDCGAIVTYTAPEGTDNCPNPTTALTAGLGSGAFFPVGITTETYQVVDLSGNVASCSFNVTVNDTEAPAVDCPANIEVIADPGLCEATATFGTPTFTDNCPGGTISQTGGPVSGSIFPVGPTAIEFTAEDAAGVQTVCSFDVVVTDDEDPVIACPADISIVILSGACDTVVTYLPPTFSDNCPGVISGLVSGPASGATLTAGSYTVTLGAQDASGNAAVCSFTIDVAETSTPTFDCPDDIEVNADPGSCETTATFAPPTANDPCSNVTVTQTGGPASGSTFQAGNTEIEFTAEDEFGNTEVCTFDIVVIDDSDPTITCPSDITIGNDPSLCGAIINYDAPIADDNCGVASVNLLSGLPSGDLFPIGITTVIYEVVDISGNTAQCTFTATVTDDEIPEITCPDDISLNIADGDCSEIVTFADATATDNCAIASITQTAGLPSGSDFPVGTSTVTFEAIDANGLSAACSFTVSVLEGVNPEITCPADIEVDNDPDICGATVSYTAPVGTDDCGGASTELTSGLGSGSEFPVGVTIEEYTVTDLSGNVETCSFTVTVNDVENPVFDCPENLTISAEAAICEATVFFDTPTVTDNCDGAIIPVQTEGPTSGSVFPVGSTTITFEATDPSGNVIDCSFEIIVEDDEDPIIDCPSDIEIDAGIACTTIVNFPDATATDNCGIATVTQIEGPLSGTEFPLGATTVTFEAIDNSGNSIACSFTVTVTEEEPPVITCPEDIQVANDLDACAAIVNYDLPTASDDCGDVTITFISGIASGESFPVGITTVTYEAEDEQGNTATCSFDVEVSDAQAPLFECPGEILLANDLGICGAIYTFDLPEASDNCPGDVAVIQTAGPSSGTELPIGVTTFVFEGTDAAGITSECTYDVVVTDSESPAFIDCPEDLIIELEANVCDTIIDFEIPSATDNCAVTGINQISGPLSGDVLSPGDYTVEFFAEDGAGNSILCSFSISIQDLTPPIVECPESFQSCDLNVVLPLPTATDNCGIVSIIQTEGPASGTLFPIGITNISFEITDANGNGVTCSYEVDVAVQTTRPEAGADHNVCSSTFSTLVGNIPDFGSGLWFQTEGSGNIVSPENAVTEVTNLSTGQNTFVWSIDPENGCDILTDSVHIFVEEGVIVEAGQDQSIILGGDAQLAGFVSPPDGTIAWSPTESLSCTDCLDPVAAPNETTVYFLDYETPLGCALTDSLTIRVLIKIPNTITPDGDNVNDVWNIPEIDKFPDATVKIFNRWGAEVFSSTGYNEPWDGTAEGDELPTASYYYIIDYNREGKENLNGTVNIIR